MMETSDIRGFIEKVLDICRCKARLAPWASALRVGHGAGGDQAFQNGEVEEPPQSYDRVGSELGGPRTLNDLLDSFARDRQCRRKGCLNLRHGEELKQSGDVLCSVYSPELVGGL